MCNDAFVRMLTPANGKMRDIDRLIAGSLSGAAVVTVTYPLEVVQTRLSIAESKRGDAASKQYAGIIDCFRQTYRTGGLRAFTRGYAASLAGITPYAYAQHTQHTAHSTAHNTRLCPSFAGAPLARPLSPLRSFCL
jgi:hypothetical protein